MFEVLSDIFGALQLISSIHYLNNGVWIYATKLRVLDFLVAYFVNLGILIGYQKFPALRLNGSILFQIGISEATRFWRVNDW